MQASSRIQVVSLLGFDLTRNSGRFFFKCFQPYSSYCPQHIILEKISVHVLSVELEVPLPHIRKIKFILVK